MTGALNRPVGWIGAAAAMVFMFANIRATGSGVGYPFLGVALACAMFVAVARPDPVRGAVVRRSSVCLLGFLTYFVLKMLLDLPDIEEMKAFSVSTTGGLIFGVAFGWIMYVLVAATFNEKTHGTRRVLMTAVYLLGCLVMALVSLKSHLGEIRSDLFLVQGGLGLYQRPGNFAAMIALAASAQFAFVVERRRRKVGTVIVLAAAFGTYLALIATLMITAQLIGSNTGFVVTGFIGLATITWILRPDLTDLRRRLVASVRLPSLPPILRRSLPRLVLSGAALTVSAAALGFVALTYAHVDYHSFRIFGFSEGSFGTHSLNSRLDLLSRNFTTQLEVDPVFGNLRADSLTTGTGTYAHSLLSLLSHLGLLGASLFVIYLVALYREAVRPRSGTPVFYSDPEYALFRAVMIMGLIVYALIGTFFTWMPLWFAFGLLYPPCILGSARLRESHNAGVARSAMEH